MSLPSAPPQYPSWRAMAQPIRMGEFDLGKYMTGTALLIASEWRAYSLQSAVGALPDGIFGPATERALIYWQSRNKAPDGSALVPDGIAGPKTQKSILLVAAYKHVEPARTSLPSHLLHGFIDFEGAGILAATNWYTPPGGTPGADCGPAQWRQYGPPFMLDGMKKAFHPTSSLLHTADALLARMNRYASIRPALTYRQRLEMSVLAHNAPFLCEQVLRNMGSTAVVDWHTKLSTPNQIAEWTVKERYPDGTVKSRYTHLEWSRVYPARLMQYMV